MIPAVAAARLAPGPAAAGLPLLLLGLLPFSVHWSFQLIECPSHCQTSCPAGVCTRTVPARAAGAAAASARRSHLPCPA